MYRFTFNYDKRGYGDLVLYKDDTAVQSWDCRTGSIDEHDQLVNALPEMDWKILTKPEWTDEPAMCLNGVGWKARLFFPDGAFSHYLIHFDGNLPGTKGCIGLQDGLHLELKDMIEQYLKEQQVIFVKVRKAQEEL